MPYNIVDIDGIQINPETKKFPVEIHAAPHALNDELTHTGVLNDNQIPIGIMRKEAHSLDPHTMTIDGRSVSQDGSKLDTIQSGAQVNNLTDSQAQSLISGSNSNWHNHDLRYFSKNELQTLGQSQVNWGNLISVPETFTPSSHTHDNRYYTESEIDSFLNDKIDKISSPVLNNFVIQTSNGNLIDSGVNKQTFALSSHNHTVSEITSGILSIERGGSNNNSYVSDKFIIFNGTKLTSSEYSNSSFASISHNHSASEITSGTLSIERGGTNSSSFIKNKFIIYDGSSLVASEYDWDNLSLSNHLHIKSNITDFNESDYVHISGNEIITGNKTFSGNITIQGTLTNVSSSDLAVSDNEIVLNSGETGSGVSKGYSGIEIDRGTLDSAFLRFDEVDDKWKIGTGSNLLIITTTDHLHDDRYYTESEIDSLLENKSNSSHLHDDRYYTKTQLQSSNQSKVNWNNLTSVPATFTPSNHLHDDRYYTESEIDSLLENKSNSSHLHDDRYYTESEIDSLLENKSNSSHLHDDRYYTESEIDSLLENKSNSSHLHDDRYYTKTEISSSFYTKTEIDANVYTKIQLDNGQLDNRYYTETELNNGQLDNRYYTKNEINSNIYTKIQLDNGQLDNRYYTKIDLGNQGAQLIGVSQITGLSSSNVQTVLEEMNSNISSISISLQNSYDNEKEINISSAPVKIKSTNTNAPLELSSMTLAPTSNLASGQIAIIENELYIYDGIREKWITPSKTLLFGKSGGADGMVLRPIGDSFYTSTGYRMSKNGVILSATIQSISNLSKKIYIRINESNVYTMTTSNGVLNLNNLNINFNSNDVLSVYVDAAGLSIYEAVCVLEFSWRK